MSPRFEVLDARFSTADAQLAQIANFGDSLCLRFKDWQEKSVIVHFRDVIAYSWDDGDAAIEPSHRDDCSYIVHDSPWLARHVAVGNVQASQEVKHFKLCFNATGVLQVLASMLEVESERDT